MAEKRRAPRRQRGEAVAASLIARVNQVVAEIEHSERRLRAAICDLIDARCYAEALRLLRAWDEQSAADVLASVEASGAQRG